MVDIDLPEVKYVMLTDTTTTERRYRVCTSKRTSTPIVDATSAQTLSFVTTASLPVRPNERMPPASVRNGLCFLGLGPSHGAEVRFDVDSRAVGCLINSPCPTSLATTRDQFGAEIIVRANGLARARNPDLGTLLRGLPIHPARSGHFRASARRSPIHSSEPTPFVQERFEPHALVVVAVSATES